MAGNNKNKKRAFSLPEVLIGMLILSAAILSFFALNQTSSAQNLDAYDEFLSQNLLSEAVEFCRGMGYEWADKYMNAEVYDVFELDEWHGILEYPLFQNSTYFDESSYFERRISMTRSEGPVMGILVLIEIRVKEEFKEKIKLSKNNISCSVLLTKRLML